MTNFEKYKEEIEKLKNKYSFTLDLDGNVVNCNNILCRNCKFQDFATCKNNRINWLFDEYKESVLSDDELELIEAINKLKKRKYRFIVKLGIYKVGLFIDKPDYCSPYGDRYVSQKDYIIIQEVDEDIFPNITFDNGIFDIENGCFIKE